MNTGLAPHFSDELNACASEMIAQGNNVGELKDGMIVVRDDSPEYRDNGEEFGLFIYSFKQEGVIFHVAL